MPNLSHFTAILLLLAILFKHKNLNIVMKLQYLCNYMRLLFLSINSVDHSWFKDPVCSFYVIVSKLTGLRLKPSQVTISDRVMSALVEDDKFSPEDLHVLLDGRTGETRILTKMELMELQMTELGVKEDSEPAAEDSKNVCEVIVEESEPQDSPSGVDRSTQIEGLTPCPTAATFPTQEAQEVAPQKVASPEKKVEHPSSPGESWKTVEISKGVTAIIPQSTPTKETVQAPQPSPADTSGQHATMQPKPASPTKQPVTVKMKKKTPPPIDNSRSVLS